MDTDMNKKLKKNSVRTFKQLTDQQKIDLLDNKDKKSTQKATNGALKQLSQFITSNSLTKLQDLTDPGELNDILSDFYPAIRPIKDEEEYSIQSLKCIRAGINHYIWKEKGWDICNDSQFVKANEMFKAILVDAKKKGKGEKKSYPPISQIDLERISEYFIHDYMNMPNPRKLQQQFFVLHYLLFLLKRQRELTWYEKRHISADSGEWWYRVCHSKIGWNGYKNHTIEDTEKNKTGRMYGNDGKNL